MVFMIRSTIVHLPTCD